MRPNDVYREAFKNCVRVSKTHDVPNLEFALAAKFAAMVSRNREEHKKHFDAGDFIQIVRKNLAKINVGRLRQLGDAVVVSPLQIKVSEVSILVWWRQRMVDKELTINFKQQL